MKWHFSIAVLICISGSMYAQLGSKQGQALVDSLLEVSLKMPDDTFKVINYDKISFNYYAINPDEGIRIAEEGLKINARLNYPEGEIRLLNTIGVLYMQKSEYVKSISYYNRAFELASTYNKKMRVANVYGNLAIVSRRMGRYYDAVDYNLKSIEIYKTFPESQSLGGMARSYGNIATIYQHQGDYVQAIDYYQKALLINERTNSKPRIVTVLSNIGSLYFALNDYQKTITYSERSILVAKEIGEQDGIASGYMRLGSAYEKLENYAKAEDYYRKALVIFEKLDNKSSIGTALANIANIARVRSKNYDQALNYLNQSNVILSGLAKNTNIPDMLASYGELYRAVAKDMDFGNPYRSMFTSNSDSLYAKSVEYIRKAIRVSDELGEVDKSSKLSFILSELYAEQNNFTSAFESYKNHILYRDKVFDDKKLKEFTKNELQYSFTKRQDSLKLENEKKQIAMQKELELNNLRFEYEMKQSAAKSAQEKQQLAFEERIKREQIEFRFAQKEAEQKRKTDLLKADQEKKSAIAAEEIKRKKQQRNASVGAFGLMLLLSIVFFTQRNRIRKEKDKSENLLLNILPYETAQELKATGSAEAKLIDQVTVLFTDFKGFTAMAERLSPQDLVNDLNVCFSAFDQIMEKFGIEKIKTIGDAYMAAGGLPSPNETHAIDVITAALEILDFIQAGKEKKMAQGLPYFEIRIGVHTGPVVAGIVGIKKFAYDIWGDTVNTASRMESSGEVGKVNISESTYKLVKDKFTCVFRGEVEAKGKGLTDMYFIEK
jgi:adenylate cyclase